MSENTIRTPNVNLWFDTVFLHGWLRLLRLLGGGQYGLLSKATILSEGTHYAIRLENSAAELLRRNLVEAYLALVTWLERYCAALYTSAGKDPGGKLDLKVYRNHAVTLQGADPFQMYESPIGYVRRRSDRGLYPNHPGEGSLRLRVRADAVSGDMQIPGGSYVPKADVTVCPLDLAIYFAGLTSASYAERAFELSLDGAPCVTLVGPSALAKQGLNGVSLMKAQLEASASLMSLPKASLGHGASLQLLSAMLWDPVHSSLLLPLNIISIIPTDPQKTTGRPKYALLNPSPNVDREASVSIFYISITDTFPIALFARKYLKAGGSPETLIRMIEDVLRASYLDHTYLQRSQELAIRLHDMVVRRSLDALMEFLSVLPSMYKSDETRRSLKYTDQRFVSALLEGMR